MHTYSKTWLVCSDRCVFKTCLTPESLNAASWVLTCRLTTPMCFSCYFCASHWTCALLIISYSRASLVVNVLIQCENSNSWLVMFFYFKPQTANVFSPVRLWFRLFGAVVSTDCFSAGRPKMPHTDLISQQKHPLNLIKTNHHFTCTFLYKPVITAVAVKALPFSWSCLWSDLCLSLH